MDLNDYRKEIDSIDDQLIALFAQRMETAEKIAEYKKANGLRVLDARREKEKMREEMAAIIGFANQLSEIDAGDVPVTAHVLPMKNVWRDDRPVPSFGRDEILANTPSVEDGYIYVPRVVE